MVVLNVVGLTAIADNQVRLRPAEEGHPPADGQEQPGPPGVRRHGHERSTSGWEGSTTVAWGGSSIAELSKEIETLAQEARQGHQGQDGHRRRPGSRPSTLALKMPTREEAIGRVVGAGARRRPAGWSASSSARRRRWPARSRRSARRRKKPRRPPAATLAGSRELQPGLNGCARSSVPADRGTLQTCPLTIDSYYAPLPRFRQHVDIYGYAL